MRRHPSVQRSPLEHCGAMPRAPAPCASGRSPRARRLCARARGRLRRQRRLRPRRAHARRPASRAIPTARPPPRRAADAARLAGVRARPAAQRRHEARPRHHGRERRAPAPPQRLAPRDRRLLADLPARRARRRRRARRDRGHHDLRQDARDRRRQRQAAVDVHARPASALGGQRADHGREPARRPGPRCSCTPPRRTADPQALARRRQRGHGRRAGRSRVTREPAHEKLGAALNIDGPDLLVATGGYIGDTPPTRATSS